MEQPDYQRMYLTLFNHVTSAIRELEQMNIGQAKALLIKGQQQTEEIYLSTGAEHA